MVLESVSRYYSFCYMMTMMIHFQYLSYSVLYTALPCTIGSTAKSQDHDHVEGKSDFAEQPRYICHQHRKSSQKLSLPSILIYCLWKTIIYNGGDLALEDGVIVSQGGAAGVKARRSQWTDYMVVLFQLNWTGMYDLKRWRPYCWQMIGPSF
jgi:hypothetical protein